MDRVTADSNIIISALHRGGKPLQLLDLARRGEIELAITDAILDETGRILSDKFEWSSGRAEDARAEIGTFTKRITPTETINAVPGDPDDNRVLECAVAAGSETIVTGDADLLRLESYRGIEIVRVADFLARFSGRGR